MSVKFSKNFCPDFRAVKKKPMEKKKKKKAYGTSPSTYCKTQQLLD